MLLSAPPAIAIPIPEVGVSDSSPAGQKALFAVILFAVKRQSAATLPPVLSTTAPTQLPRERLPTTEPCAASRKKNPNWPLSAATLPATSTLASGESPT